MYNFYNINKKKNHGILWEKKHLKLDGVGPIDTKPSTD